MSKTTQTEIEYKRLFTKRKHQYLKPRKCHKNSVRLETIDVSTSVTGVTPSADVPLSLTKSDSCWARCRNRVMGMFTFLFRDDVVKLVVGKSRFDSERSPVPYRTQSVSVSFSIFLKKRVFIFLKPVEVEPGVLYELMETVAYNDITEDSKRWVFARPYNANAPILKLEDNKVRVIDTEFPTLNHFLPVLHWKPP